MVLLQDQGRPPDQPPAPAQHTGQRFSTTTPWKGSCKLPSTLPPRVVELRNMGRGGGLAACTTRKLRRRHISRTRTSKRSPMEATTRRMGMASTTTARATCRGRSESMGHSLLATGGSGMLQATKTSGVNPSSPTSRRQSRTTRGGSHRLGILGGRREASGEEKRPHKQVHRQTRPSSKSFALDRSPCYPAEPSSREAGGA